jgi:hypothetical protein
MGKLSGDLVCIDIDRHEALAGKKGSNRRYRVTTVPHEMTAWEAITGGIGGHDDPSAISRLAACCSGPNLRTPLAIRLLILDKTMWVDVLQTVKGKGWKIEPGKPGRPRQRSGVPGSRQAEAYPY